MEATESQSVEKIGKWTKHQTSGFDFSPKSGFAGCVMNNAFFSLGGFSNDKSLLEPAMFLFESNSWIRMGGADSMSLKGVSLNSAVSYGNSIYFFGGMAKIETQGFLKRFTESQKDQVTDKIIRLIPLQMKWIEIQPKTKLNPSPRDGHSAVMYKNEMFIFGGSDELHLFDDMYRFDVDLAEWNKVEPSGEIPKNRRLHTACIFDDGNGDAMFVFGGYNGSTSFNDLCRYDFQQNKWEVIEDMKGSIPPPRYAHSCVIYKDCMYIFGGYGGGKGYRNDFFRYHFKSKTWTEIQGVSSADSVEDCPSPRRRHVAIVYHDKMYVFGGKGSAFFDDVWSYDFQLLGEEPANTLAHDFQSLLNSPKYSDISFSFPNGKKIYGHRAILAARCEFFQHLFDAVENQEDSNATLLIEDVSFPCFYGFLVYLYTDNIDIPWDLIEKTEGELNAAVNFYLDLLSISERYFQERLKYRLGSILSEKMTVQNVISILDYSLKFNHASLHQACKEFILQNRKEIPQEEMEQLPKLVLLELMELHDKQNYQKQKSFRIHSLFEFS